MTDNSEADDILFEERGGLRLITLNRPKALNAISLAMVRAMAEKLAAWAEDDAVQLVMILGAGGKAFAAGGDIQKLFDEMTAGDMTYPQAFFGEEYRLNNVIKTYPKPFVALYNGIVMGGGVGVSVHGGHRIATDATTFAMPETGIGFFPDVGGTYFLPRLNNGLGQYMALTGGRLDGGDCVAEGLADAYLPVAKTDALIAALAEASSANVQSAIQNVAEPAPAGRLAGNRKDVTAAFDRPSLNAVLEALTASDNEWAAKQLKVLHSKSPLSVALAWEQLERGAKLDFEGCLTLEYRIALKSFQMGEFREGVRALIVDKDNQPKWRDARIEDVAPSDVQAHFEVPEIGDLTF
jgi:enoyl-CoA hydratase